MYYYMIRETYNIFNEFGPWFLQCERAKFLKKSLVPAVGKLKHCMLEPEKKQKEH